MLFYLTTAALQPLLQQRPAWAFAFARNDRNGGNADSAALELVVVSLGQQARHYTVLDPNAQASCALDRNSGHATAVVLGSSECYNASLLVLRHAVATLPQSAVLRVHLARELVHKTVERGLEVVASEAGRLFESAVELAPQRFPCVRGSERARANTRAKEARVHNASGVEKRVLDVRVCERVRVNKQAKETVCIMCLSVFGNAELRERVRQGLSGWRWKESGVNSDCGRRREGRRLCACMRAD